MSTKRRFITDANDSFKTEEQDQQQEDQEESEDQDFELKDFPEPLKSELKELIEARAHKYVVKNLQSLRKKVFNHIEDESYRTDAILKDTLTRHANRIAFLGLSDKEINIEATSTGKPNFDNISNLSPSIVNPYYRNQNFFQSTTPLDFSQISAKKSGVSSPRARSPSNHKKQFKKKKTSIEPFLHPDGTVIFQHPTIPNYYEQDHPDLKGNPFAPMMAENYQPFYHPYFHHQAPFFQAPEQKEDLKKKQEKDQDKNLEVYNQNWVNPYHHYGDYIPQYNYGRFGALNANFGLHRGYGGIYGGYGVLGLPWNFPFYRPTQNDRRYKLNNTNPNDKIDPIYRYLDPISCSLQERTKQGRKITDEVPQLTSKPQGEVYKLIVIGDPDLSQNLAAQIAAEIEENENRYRKQKIYLKISENFSTKEKWGDAQLQQKSFSSPTKTKENVEEIIKKGLKDLQKKELNIKQGQQGVQNNQVKFNLFDPEAYDDPHKFYERKVKLSSKEILKKKK